MTLARLVWFDLTRGLPAAFGVLRRRLGAARFARLALAFARARLAGDPLAPLGPPAGPRDRLTRHQLRPVLLLDRALRQGLGLAAPEALALLGEVVAASGARFLAHSVPAVTPAAWSSLDGPARRRLVDRTLGRFFNAETEVRAVADGAFAFDVTACRFVQLARALGRPELAALYCAADGAWLADPAAPFVLERAGTIAGGAPRCDFRFGFPDG